MKRYSKGLTLVFLMAIVSATTARSADIAAPPAAAQPPSNQVADGWQFELTPYVWITGMTGTVSPFRRAPEVHVDSSFSDILKDLNVAGFANAWGTNGKFGFYADLMYVDMSEGHSGGPVTIPVYGVTVPAINVDVDSKLFMGALFGAVRVVEDDGFNLDALAGIRVAHLDTAVNAAIPAAALNYSAASDFGWVEPAIGFRAAYDFGNRFRIVGEADISGFSVGSDLTWQAMATVNYAITRSAALAFGYRYLSIDYDDDGHVFDTVLQGPTIGMTFSF